MKINTKIKQCDLLAPFLAACHPNKEELIGVELEKFVLDKDTLRPLPMSGPKSIQTLMRELSTRFAWHAEWDGDEIILLRKQGHSISLEPGGQIEFSSKQHAFVDHARLTEQEHLMQLQSITKDWDVLWCGLGLQPIVSLAETDWVSKKRYLHMRSYLKGRGTHSHHMMKMTSSIQVAADFISEEDAVRKTLASTKLSPIFTAMFANSCLYEGKLSDFKSYRSHIWQNTDPDRCGLPPCYFHKDFSFNTFVEWALDVPVFFIQRKEELLGPLGMSFRQFMKRGYQGHEATLSDWQLHLNCLFPEVRLRSYIELRCFDRQKSLLSFAAPTLTKLLLYSPHALSQILTLLKDMSYADTVSALQEAARHGLQGKFGKHSLEDLANECLDIALASMKNFILEEKISCFEKESIDAILDLTRQGLCPSDIIIQDVKSNKSLRQIILEQTLV